jgi:zinc transport system substrate-binding protein
MKKLLNNILIILSAAVTVSFLSAIPAATNDAAPDASTLVSDRVINSSSINLQNSTLQEKIKVVASFYPIFEFVKKVGGDRVEVSSLIPVGIEPHDFEPTIQQIQSAETAKMIVFNGGGFEGQWLKDINAKFVIDTSKGLNLTVSSDKHNDQHVEVLVDPHIWLDPLLAKQQVEKIRDGFIKIDPANTVYYNGNAMKFMSELDNLDRSIRAGLSNCEKRDFITFHRAFRYFANRYNLTEHGIHPNSPEGEILPQRIQQVIGLARDMGLDTIYSEELADPRLANVIAQEIPNGKVLILSPIEGINQEEQKAGIGYISKMNENIENLKKGLKCQ